MGRRQTIWLSYQFLVTCAVAIFFGFVAISNIANDENAAIWWGILGALPVFIILFGLLIRKAIRKENE